MYSPDESGELVAGGDELGKLQHFDCSDGEL